MKASTRKIASISFFLLLPVLLNYFSPYLIIDGLFQGVFAGAFFVWLAFLLSGLVVGRAACAYVCPYGGLQTALDEWRRKPLKVITHLRGVRYALGIIWVIFILFPLVKRAKLPEIQPFYLTEGYISVDTWGKAVFMLVLILLLSLAPLFLGKRATCHYVCPMSILNVASTWTRNKLKLPGLRLTADASKCVSCGSCSRACSMSLDVRAMVQQQAMDHLECILCGECVTACGKGAIVRSFGGPAAPACPVLNKKEGDQASL